MAGNALNEIVDTNSVCAGGGDCQQNYKAAASPIGKDSAAAAAAAAARITQQLQSSRSA